MRSRLVCAVLSAALFLAGCGSGDVEVKAADDPKAGAAPTSAGVPTDDELLALMRDRIQGEISVELSDAGSGEIVWSGRDLTWYYQRGYIVKRPAQIEGFDEAVLEVGGLSLWVYDGSGWRFQKDLVTWNRYEGIPDPDASDLVALVEGSQINYMPVNLGGKPGNFRIADPANFEWHSAKSVSFNFQIDAPQIDWPGQKLNQTTLTLRTRVYRNDVDSPWRDPITPEQVDAIIRSGEARTPQELSELSRTFQ